MIQIVIEILIVFILAAAAAWAVYKIVKKLRRGGGCCGEHETAVKGIAVQDKNKAHYPYSFDVKVGGMTCQNCAKKIENTFNALDGVWAKVRFDQSTARVRSKRKISPTEIRGAVAKAGYTVETVVTCQSRAGKREQKS